VLSRYQNRDEWSRLVYKNCIKGIEAVRRRQWMVTNYVLLLFAAIIGFGNLMHNLDCQREFGNCAYCLIFIATWICLLGIYFIIHLHRIQAEYRAKLFNIVRSNPYLKRIDLRQDKEATFRKYFFSITAVLICLVIGGMIFVIMFFEPFTAINPRHIVVWPQFMVNIQDVFLISVERLMLFLYYIGLTLMFAIILTFYEVRCFAKKTGGSW